MHLDGRAQSVVTVLEALELPNQPTVGTTQYVPLGGNGFDAPFSYYAVDIQLDADVSGGNNDIIVLMDPQFMGLVSFIQTLVISVSAATPSKRLITMTASDHCRDSRDCVFEAVDGQASILWTPPGLTLNATPLHTPSFRSTIENVDGDDHFFNLRIYNFKKDAEKKVPLRLIMANLVRSQS